MLDFFRSKSNSILIYLMFAIIIAVFAFTFGAIGPDQACGGAGGVQVADLGEVDGNVIDTNLINMVEGLSIDAPSPNDRTGGAFQRMRDFQTTRYARLGLVGPFVHSFGKDPSKISPIGLDKWMDDAVETRLVAGYAHSLGMAVSDNEMNARLVNLVNQFVDETGAFDNAGFIAFLRNRLGTTPSAFEHFVKDELLRERIIRLIAGSAQVSDTELKSLHKLQNDKVRVAHISIDKISAKPLVPVTAAETNKWLADNADKAQSEYDKQKAGRFTSPATYVLRGVKVDATSDALTADMTPEQKGEHDKERAAAKAKADKLLVDVKAALAAPTEEGAPATTASQRFATFAAANSDDVTKANGGKIAGAKKATELRLSPFGPSVQAAVPTLKAGDVTDVLEVDGGFWIVFVDTINAEKVTPFATAKSEIARDFVAADKVDGFKGALADAVLAQAKADPKASLEDVAKAINAKYGVTDAKGLKAREATPFARTQIIGDSATVPFVFGVGRSAELVRMAFAATTDAPVLPAIVTVQPGDKLVVARFIEAVPAEEATPEDLDGLRDIQNLYLQRGIYRGWYEGYLAKKVADGDVSFNSTWQQLRNTAVKNFVEAGGRLPTWMVPTEPVAAK